MSDYSPPQWTVRLKNHNITVLFLVSPVQALISLRPRLLAVLKARNITEINGNRVPTNPAHIELGVPVDRNDLHKGWQTIDAAAADYANKTRTRTADPASVSLQSLGMKDAHAVAFRFRDPASRAANGEEDPGWDVVLPSFEEEDDDL